MNKTKLNSRRSPVATRHSPLTMLMSTLVLAACARMARSVRPMADRLQFGPQGGDRKGPANPDRFRHRELHVVQKARTKHAARLGHRSFAEREFRQPQDGRRARTGAGSDAAHQSVSDVGLGRPRWEIIGVLEGYQNRRI